MPTVDWCLRRGATADFSPAYQGRDLIADWSRRVATIEKPLQLQASLRDANELLDYSLALKGRAKVSRRSATKRTTQLPRYQ